MKDKLINKRIDTIDLLKLIAMCGIVLVHLLNQGGVIRSIEISSFKYYIINFLLTLSYLSVNIFAIITGFLYCEKKRIKISNILILILEVVFYSICITLLFYSFNWFNMREEGIKNILFGFFPFLKGKYWYIIAYCFLFSLIPFLNIFIANASERVLKRLLIIVFCLISIIGEGTEIINFIFNEKIIADLFHINSGYSPFWLIYCYLVGAYLFKVNNEKINKKKLFIKIIILILFTSTLNYVSKYICLKRFGIIKNYELFISYISPLNIIISALIVMFFVINNNIKISNIILKLSKSSFAVYIIHSHTYIYDNIIKDAFVEISSINIWLLIIYLITVVIIIYILSACIDKIRMWIFKWLKLEQGIRCLDKIEKI